MKKVLVFILFFPVFVSAQPVPSPQKEELTKIYSKAIDEYIKAVNETDLLSFDTLFVGPREYLHGVKLPSEIRKTKIVQLTQEEGERKSKYSKPFVYINLISIITKERAEFLFITFIVEKAAAKTDWLPKHNYTVNFNYNVKDKEFKFDKQRFEYLYSNKYTKKK